MKKAVILHGTDSTPEENWFPWLRAKLVAAGYEVWVPQLPDSHRPNRQRYNAFLLRGEWDFTDNVVIGHSSGGVAILNLLMDERCPRIKLGVMVSAWASGYPRGWQDITQFEHLFPPNGFNFDLIRSKADKLAFLHSADDPYCPLEQAKYLSQNLQAPLTVLETGGHLSLMELPPLWDLLAPSL